MSTKGLRKLLRSLEQQGAHIKTTRNGWMVYPPDKTKPGVAIHGTPSDHRSWANMTAELRRAGFHIT
jgi:hypothetical protein